MMSLGPKPLTETSTSLVRAAMQRYGRLGRAARQELEERLTAALRWAEERHDATGGEFEPFADRVMAGAEVRFFQDHPRRALAYELHDERCRAAAARGGGEMVRYLRYWHRRLAKVQTALGARWGVPGMTPEEVRDELETDLIMALRKPALFELYERTGQEATQCYLDARRKRLARRHRMFVAMPADELPTLADHQPNPEQTLHDETRSTSMAGLVARLGDGRELTRPAKKWLAQFLRYLDAHDELNLTEVAELVGKAPSSACRAAEAIMEALERMNACALLDLPEAPPPLPGARRRRTGEARRSPDRGPEFPRPRRRRRR
jgi:hypothetical protein